MVKANYEPKKKLKLQRAEAELNVVTKPEWAPLYTCSLYELQAKLTNKLWSFSLEELTEFDNYVIGPDDAVEKPERARFLLGEDDMFTTREYLRFRRLLDFRQFHVNQFSFWLDTDAALYLELAIAEYAHTTMMRLEKRPKQLTDFCIFYEAHARMFFAALEQSPDLVAKINNGNFNKQELVEMEYNILVPENWIDARANIDEKKKNGHQKLSANTTEYTCRRCGNIECNAVPVQTRSLDEPATIFVKCLKCELRWRIRG